MKKKYLLHLVISSIIITSCNNDDKKDTQNGSFDRKELLVNFADNIIIPSYDRLYNNVNSLQNAILDFCNMPNPTTLENARSIWKQTSMSWQYANGYNFGPAGEAGIKKSLNEEIGTFPISKTKIENYISVGDTSFNNFDRDTRGLYAIDYLLFDENVSVNDLILKFSNSNNRKQYLLACVNNTQKRIDAVKKEWIAYRQLFVDNTGTDIGSSTSYLYNEFLKSYEGLKNFKFGIPLGRRPGQTNSLPELVEAYYSGISTDLAKEHWKSVKQIWEGTRADGSDGIGFREYLASVEGGNELIASTIAQIAATDAAFSDIPAGKLSSLITSNYSTVDNVHTELQKTTRFFKSDLSSLIGVSVTYSSGDGD
jgi:predicted lipoprotein